MYALERRVCRAGLPYPQHRWERYAVCGNRRLLERVRAGQDSPKEWRIVPCQYDQFTASSPAAA